MGSQDVEELQRVLQVHKGSVIGTHSDTFHCDEVLACTMLMYTERFGKARVIVRTRDSEVHPLLDTLIDVGSEYIPETLRFDHH